MISNTGSRLTLEVTDDLTTSKPNPVLMQRVRDHVAILAESIARNSGVVIKTIGDAVMASFASSEDAINSAFDAQAE